jgi:hypothetical protein
MAFKPRKRILLPRVFNPGGRLSRKLNYDRQRQQAEGLVAGATE